MDSLNKDYWNTFAFIADNTTEWEVFPPEDLFKSCSKNDIFSLIKNYVDSWNYNKKPYLSLYFNFPYCNERCSYCCLASIWLNNKSKIEKYILELISDIKAVWRILKLNPQIKIDILFFSWWTFTIIDDFLFELFLKTIKDNFQFKDNYTYEMELHPATTTENKVNIMKKYWVNTVMLWIQSLDELVLKNSNRIQTNKQVFNAVNLIRKFNFKTLNVDIIAWLPFEKISTFVNNLKIIITKINPDIIHMYPFSPTDNTLFTKMWHKFTSEQIINRDKMFLLWEKLIKSFDYIKSDWYVKVWKEVNSIWWMKCYKDMSVISFWYPLDIQWYLEWVWCYTSRYNSSYAIYTYKSKDIILRRELFRLTWLWKDINLAHLNNKFWIDVLKYLSSEFRVLFDSNIINFKWSEIISFNTRYVWEKTICRWIFLPKNLLKEFLLKNKINHNINYIDKFRKKLWEYYK